MPGNGPTWIDGLVVLRRRQGRERMFAAYVKVKPPLDVYARGLAEWDDDKEEFEKLADFDAKAPLVPQGHAFRHTGRGHRLRLFRQSLSANARAGRPGGAAPPRAITRGTPV